MPPLPLPTTGRRRSSKRWRSRVAPNRLLFGLLAVLLLAGGTFSLRYRWVWVLGDSMNPTFHTGDLLLVDKWAYRRVGPARRDIIVARHHDEFIVKRVVGLPGETVEVRHGLVEVDGIRQVAYHDYELGLLDIGAGRLLADRYAILGDNRGVSPDLFIHAVVSPAQILGKVIFSFTR